MIRFTRAEEIDFETVLRRWVEREARKEQYPDADPSDWSAERLVRELDGTYEEPVTYASFRDPEWSSLSVSGSEMGKFDPYPGIGCNALTAGGTLSKGIDRLQTEDIEANYPDATEQISTFRRMYPHHDFGAVVMRQFDEHWPPVALDGNHRSWAAVWASRRGVDVELEVHLGHETTLDELPFKER